MDVRQFVSLWVVPFLVNQKESDLIEITPQGGSHNVIDMNG
jgi:hypothetical protein